MEAKYLKDRDTGEIFYPILHVDGVVDLNVSTGTDTLTERNFDVPSNPYLSASTHIVYREYINMVYIGIQGDLKTDGREALKSNGKFSVTLAENFPVCNVNLNLICVTSDGLHPYCTVSGRIVDKVLEISGIAAEPVYQMVDGEVQESVVYHNIDTIMGCGYN